MVVGHRGAVVVTIRDWLWDCAHESPKMISDLFLSPKY